MLPDADLIIACPHCHAPARVFQLFGGNVLDAVTWTDGWMDAPLMPRPPRITRCGACSQFYWIFMAPQIAYAQAGEGEFADAPHITSLDEATCFEALAAGLGASPELELELRVFTWWRGNDAFREPQHAPGHSSTPEAIANMERFIEMTANQEEDLLLFRSEALRHLGRFDEALASLDGVGCSDYHVPKTRQIELITARSRDLAILYSADRPPESYLT